ncbi:MAG TPA: oligopeptide transporter, OPT family [Thermoanaerobaculia bacterium]|nr:oligopeptide transporter, OPT family [Thermoanaerobaculia bacterium]
MSEPTATPRAQRPGKSVPVDEPYIPADRRLPEITFKAVVLGIVLSAVLGAANAYLGLFAGMTVSASIPAAVISMGILRLFRQSNILENNIVQTAASAGESLAAGVIFTIPALILLGAWTEFDYWEVVMISGLGGLLGVVFTIPLRRALIVDDPLRFPEGVATAEVLKVGERGGKGVFYVAVAGVVGALFKLGGVGLLLWSEAVGWARRVGGGVAYFGSNLSPALVGVGYIVGLNIAVLIFLGGAFNWWIAIPLVAATQGLPPGTAEEAAFGIWSAQTRYLGVGAMLVGGLWALVKLRKSLVRGVRSGIEAYRRARAGGGEALLRTERDTPMQWAGVVLMVAAVPLFLLFEYFTGSWGIAAVMAAAMLVAGFLFAAVAGYMAGLVGSSNNPISGVTIATLLVSSLLLLLLMGSGNPAGPAAAIFIAAVVACAAAIAGDNMQDLKAGHVLGATPYKQQIMQAIGVIAAALVIAPVLSLLLQAYGIGAATPEHPNPLTAPQASLMAAVAGGVFGGELPWGMVAWGMLVAVAVILLDVWLERRGSDFRTPVLAVAVGIYLPLELEVPILLGGLIAWAAGRVYTRSTLRGGHQDEAPITEARTIGERHGLLFAAGLITGEALVGILMAVPIVMTGDPGVLALGIDRIDLLGIALLGVVMVGLYKVAVGPAKGLVGR